MRKKKKNPLLKTDVLGLDVAQGRTLQLNYDCDQAVANCNTTLLDA